jgi:hypothetical protein
MKTPITPDEPASLTAWRPHLFAWALSCVLLVFPFRRGQAENRAEYRYEDYREDDDRMQVQTHSVWFEYELHQKVTARGSYVNDALSGATPTGGPGLPGEKYESVRIQDERNAGFLETAIRAGRTTTTPQISYSEESDYRSLGISLTEAIDFNQRNTTLILGVARANDEVSRRGWDYYLYKGNWDFLVGINQVLDPRTVVTFNLTFGYADGYLTDPYKGINISLDLPPYGPYDPEDNTDFDTRPDVTNDRERRPSHRFKQVAFAGITHLFAPVNGSLDANYRFHHDDWGIIAHTVQLTWNQKLWKRLTLSPLFRYHRQGAADFYRLRVDSDTSFAGSRVAFGLDNSFAGAEGDPGFDDALADPANFQIISVPFAPDYYSADYRLSELQTFTFGMTAAIELHENISLVLGYKRYLMEGLDGRTAQDVYPDANIFTIGLNGRF